jgi:hypothetical protein
MRTEGGAKPRTPEGGTAGHPTRSLTQTGSGGECCLVSPGVTLTAIAEEIGMST